MPKIYVKGRNPAKITVLQPQDNMRCPHHGLTIYQVSAQQDVNCRRIYPETKELTDGILSYM